MLLRAKQIEHITGYSETQSRRFIKRIKEKNNLQYREAAVSIAHLCTYFSIDEEKTIMRLKNAKK